MNLRKQNALDYHRTGRKGKIEVIATKPCRTQAALSLAYTPGVGGALQRDCQVTRTKLEHSRV